MYLKISTLFNEKYIVSQHLILCKKGEKGRKKSVIEYENGTTGW
jgi:hypothetical protein